jgi:hypothetical protein
LAPPVWTAGPVVHLEVRVSSRDPHIKAFSAASNSGGAMDLDEEVSSEAPAVYVATTIKRCRATKAAIQDRQQALHQIVAEQQPMTVRQVFYQATIHRIVEKEESGYRKVQRNLVEMRKSGWMPYGWIVDNIRSRRKPRSYGSPEHAIMETAKFYRKDLWANADCYVEIWLEKDALSGVIDGVTARYDVPLMVARGYSSITFTYEAAEFIGNLDVPVFIYHLGDFDPSGVDAGKKIERDLRAFAPNAEIHFERLAVNPDQINAWNLPSRPTKQSDSRAKNFGDISVELDAIVPDDLRWLVEEAIQRHLPPEQLKILKAAEEDERRLFRGLVGMIPGGRHA